METEIKSKNGKNVYYSEEIFLDGVPYLVYNNFLPAIREKYSDWLKEVFDKDNLELFEKE